MKSDAKKIIMEFGGAATVASLCEVSKQAVYQWRDTGKIPRARVLFLQLLRPDLFDASELAPRCAGAVHLDSEP